MALEVALSVQQELSARAEEADRLCRQQVERARYEADLAQRRYMQVDPDNRLVADALEADWNHKLRALTEAQEEYERQRQADRLVLDEQQRTEILSIATDFPRLWRNASTPDRERKRMVRLMLEDVTLLKGEALTAYVRFKGGATRTLTLPSPLMSWQTWQTDSAVVREIDRLLDYHTEGEVAGILNERGYRSGQGKAFTERIVARIRRSYGLRDRFTRLRAAGMLTREEFAAAVGVAVGTIKEWQRRGLLRAYPYNGRNMCLYEPPGSDTPKKGAWKRPRHPQVSSTTESYQGGAV